MMTIFRKGCEDPNGLSDDERWIFGTFMFSMFQGFQEAYYLHLQSRTEEFYWQHLRQSNLFYLSRPGGRAWWEGQGRNMLDQTFVQYVNEQLDGNGS